MTDALSLTATYDYNDLNRLERVTYSDGTYSEQDSSCCGITGAVRDRAGRLSYTDYDALKRPIRMQDASGNVVSLEYDAEGSLTHIIDAKGNVTNFIYDGPLNTRPIPIKEMQANGQWIHTCWDDFSYVDVLRREGLVERGNLFIPPPVNDIIFAEGLFTILNKNLGLMLDQFEEQTIEDPNCLATMSAIIRDFSKNNYSKKRIVRKKVGQMIAPIYQEITAEIEADVIANWLEIWSSFIEESAQLRKTVFIEL